LWCCRTSRADDSAPPSPVRPPLLEELEPPLEELVPPPDELVPPLEEPEELEDPFPPSFDEPELLPEVLEGPPLDDPDPLDAGAPSRPVTDASSLAPLSDAPPCSSAPHDHTDAAAARLNGKRK
jgi:hypothetical protein